jgi:4'-phosphopantetheinyl transferase
MYVYYCDISNFINDNTLFEQEKRGLMDLIDNERLEKMKKYKSVSDEIRSLTAGLLIQVALQDHINKTEYLYSDCESIIYLKDKLSQEGKIEIHYSPNGYGKPFIIAYPNFHFSLSHSGSYVALACHDEKIGLDVQEERGSKAIAISDRFYAKEERKILEEAPDKESQTHAFYRIWSAKEAYIKYTGRGISENLASFTVDLERHIVKKADTDATTGYIYEPLHLENTSSMICSGSEVRNIAVIKVVL